MPSPRSRRDLLPWLAITAAACSSPERPAPSGHEVVARDLRAIPSDLQVPAVHPGAPAAGRRVRATLAEYVGTDVHHVLYLPVDWVADRRYPVLVEFAGNGPYRSGSGDVSTGNVEDCSLGYGISGGRDYLWLCLPFVNETGGHNQRQWWGSVGRTIDYCKTVVPRVCAQYGGDPDAVVLIGFSRGAIACNYIGLHDDEIAKLWCGFVCHSHYDGVRPWNYEGSDREAAAARLRRLGARAQWISHERSVSATERYLREVCPDGAFTFRSLPFDNHTDAWVLRDVPLRRELREWVAAVLPRAR